MGQEICEVTDGSGGVYYLNVTSETFDDLSACDNAARFNGTLDDLSHRPNMNRHCTLPTAGDPGAPADAFNAIIGVYSDTNPADLAAATRFCRVHLGKDN